jgi:hypothetical protein
MVHDSIASSTSSIMDEEKASYEPVTPIEKDGFDGLRVGGGGGHAGEGVKRLSTTKIFMLVVLGLWLGYFVTKGLRGHEHPHPDYQRGVEVFDNPSEWIDEVSTSTLLHAVLAILTT